MFVHATHLPQRLAADDYSSPQFHQDELESMFLPGWHCIGTLAELKRDGDYFTTELLGRPLLCWRSGGEVRTFLNVCCHRFCMLTHEQHGSFRDRMKCQYHGWEYDTGGNPRKIPDAQSFRPLVKNQLQLTSYRTETVGQLVFVSLASAGPSLAEYLGDEMHRLCQDWFSTDQRHLKEFDSDVEANWKIVVENVLESYHIATVHAKSFTDYPPFR